MKTSWLTITGIGLSCLVGACFGGTSSDNSGGSGTPTPGTAGTPATGTAGATGEGSAGSPGTGTAGGAGTPGTGAGGSPGSGTAGAGGSDVYMAGAPSTAGAAGTVGSTTPLPRLVTSAPNAFWKTDAQLTEVTTGTVDVTVNPTTVAQTWDGFGGAFNELGWKYLMTLSQADRDAAIQLLFGSDGARFNMGRIPMGASDYAIARYTLDETVNDTTMAMFSINQDMQYLIPYVKAAMAVKPSIRLWASPWTPPTWMKNSPCSKTSAIRSVGIALRDPAHRASRARIADTRHS